MIKLLSTDFDGTLVDHFAPVQVAPAFYEMIRTLRKEGVRWAINTGRGLQHILEGLREFRFEVEPDYVLTNERELFHRPEGGDWQDYGDWNRRCMEAHEALFLRSGPLLRRISEYLERETNANPIYENDRMVGIYASTEAEMDKICLFLDAAAAAVPQFHYQRNTIYLRFCHAEYSKGAALAELCRLLNITPEETFAAGDHFNDLSMLDGKVARWVAAPSNAVEPVKALVRRAGGIVADEPCSFGVVTAVRRFQAKIARSAEAVA
jgi:HAD superfamily hydrolase (TIGR01484 family)